MSDSLSQYLYKYLLEQPLAMQSQFLRSVASLSFLNAALASVACTSSAITAILPGNATLNFAVPVPQNGSFGQGQIDLEFPTNATSLPPLCAVSVNVKSSPTSSYNFGLFLPETWNSRSLTAGEILATNLMFTFSRRVLIRYRKWRLWRRHQLA